MSQQSDTTECSHVSIKYEAKKGKKEKKKPLWNTWRKENAEAGAFSLVRGQKTKLQMGQKDGLWVTAGQKKNKVLIQIKEVGQSLYQ